MADYAAISRLEWLALASRFYSQLDKTFAGLSAADWERHTPYLGWRARDVVAHMTSAASSTPACRSIAASVTQTGCGRRGSSWAE